LLEVRIFLFNFDDFLLPYIDICLLQLLRPKLRRMNKEEAIAAARALVHSQTTRSEGDAKLLAQETGVELSPEQEEVQEGPDPESPELERQETDGTDEFADESSDSDLNSVDDDEDSSISEEDPAFESEDSEERNKDRARRNEEDDALADLDRELQLLMSEAPESKRKPIASAIDIPSVRKGPTAYVPGAAFNSNRTPTLALLTKRGTKAVTKEISVPEDSPLARHAAAIRARDEEERLELKQLVLNYERSQHEEDAQKKNRTLLFSNAQRRRY
jgi:regulator of nonsense transcripts 2